MKLRKRLALYEALRKRRDSLRALLDPLARGEAELDLAANIELANASIIEKASVPRGPSRPNKVKYVLIAIVLGLALGGWLAYAIDGLDETIRTPENLKRAAPLQVLGSISLMNRRMSKHGRGRAFVADARAGFALAEEFRSLRTGLLTAAPWKKEGRSGAILVTSPGLGEGKTTISVNAAEAFAQLGRPVVIVDADIRRARVHEILDCPRGPGLVDVLQGEVPLKDAVRETALQNLLILPAGSVTSQPAEILASDKVQPLIHELKTNYGIVWIDSPPVMLVADSRTLVPLADLILLVVRSTSTRRRELERTYELVVTAAGACEDPTAAAKIVAVLNGVPYAVSKQYGYYRSAYGRYYYRPATPAASPASAAREQETASAEGGPNAT
jgi:capsular exopolysaccharide synthesis family protein